MQQKGKAGAGILNIFLEFFGIEGGKGKRIRKLTRGHITRRVFQLLFAERKMKRVRGVK